MIKKLTVKNFKSHQETILDFANLTVLCGSNGVGKSSIIHSLLLLRESFFGNSNFEYLDLKSNPVNIGTAKDALYQSADINQIQFNLETDIQALNFSFEAKDSDLVKTLIAKSPGAVHETDRNKLLRENLFSTDCQFISAARLGPQATYTKDDVVVDVYKQISVMEGKAEHFVHYLYRNKDKDVLTALLSRHSPLKDLFNQSTAWEREISQNINIVVQDLGNLGYELRYQFNTDSGKTNEFKASNVGFGVTYVMPIIVAILSAQPNTLLFIENPEAHLHPNGQSKLAELICLAAQSGVQIILETHSDHIINGILVQSKRFEDTREGIDKTNVLLYHFEREEDKHFSKSQKIKIEEGGIIRYTPSGFFDQFTIDRKFLMGF